VTPLPERTPEQFLELFEYRAGRYPLEPWSVGLLIIRAWMNLRSQRTVSQDDLDGLLKQFTREGLSVPERHPWGPT
jgi:hypothetical protein